MKLHAVFVFTYSFLFVVAAVIVDLLTHYPNKRSQLSIAFNI